MQITNHLGETFEIRLLGNELDENKKPIEWWFKSFIQITEDGKKRKKFLKFTLTEDLYLFTKWIEDVGNGNFKKTRFEFLDGFIWCRLWKRGNERFIRVFLQGDAYRVFCWDWRIQLDKEKKLLKYALILFNSAYNDEKNYYFIPPNSSLNNNTLPNDDLK